MELGGYFSIKRNATSIPGDTWLDVEEVAPYCKAILEVFRYSICCFPSFFSVIDSRCVFLLGSCIHSLTYLLNHTLARSLSRLIVVFSFIPSLRSGLSSSLCVVYPNEMFAIPKPLQP